MDRSKLLKDFLKNQALPEEEKSFEDKALEVGGEVLEKAEPALRLLDYPAGLVRGSIAGGLEAATGRDDLVDIKDVLRGKAPASSEIMEKLGVPEGKSLSDILPEMYSESGKGMRLQKGGLFDPTARGTAGAALDVALDPLSLLGAKAVKEVAKEPKSFVDDLLRKLKDERGELDLSQKRALANLKNPTEREIQKIAGIPEDVKNTSLLQEAREKQFDVSDFAHRLRAGVSEDMPPEYQIQEVLKQIYPHLKDKIPLEITPDPSYRGRYQSTRAPYKGGILKPEKILLSDVKDPNILGYTGHEYTHFEDSLQNPFFKTMDEFTPSYLETDLQEFIGSQRGGYLAKKLMALRPDLNYPEALELISNNVFKGLNELPDKDLARIIAGQRMMDLMGGPENFMKFSKGFHHSGYPTGFEMEKSLELLNPNKPLKTPDLTENERIIREIYEENLKNPTLSENAIIEMYKAKKFPNIENLIKEKDRFSLFAPKPKI
jgi:hypothetical protein